MVSPPQTRSAENLYYDALDLLEQGHPHDAEALLRRCLVLDPGMVDALHGLIRALRELGQLDEAIALAHRLIELDPEEPLAHTSLSILYQHKGMIAEAEAESVKAKLLGWKRQLREEDQS